MIKKNDIVCRYSYDGDMLFEVKSVSSKNMVSLSALSIRLSADAPIDDLELVSRESLFLFKKFFQSDVEKKIEQILKDRKVMEEENTYMCPGKVLHVDADEGYLNMCLTYYKQLNVPAEGIYIEENRQSLVIKELLAEYMPDILVLTGHDAISREADSHNIRSYTSSSYFVEAVKKARQMQSSKDSLVIFAGACQSAYKEIMEAGANYASSPERVMIHALDPVFVAEKIAFTSMEKVISPAEAVKNTISGIGGLGGLETRGCLRIGNPLLK